MQWTYDTNPSKSCALFIAKIDNLGRGGGQVVSVITLYSDDPSVNPTKVYIFVVQIALNERKLMKRGPGMAICQLTTWVFVCQIIIIIRKCKSQKPVERDSRAPTRTKSKLTATKRSTFFTHNWKTLLYAILQPLLMLLFNSGELVHWSTCPNML